MNKKIRIEVINGMVVSDHFVVIKEKGDIYKIYRRFDGTNQFLKKVLATANSFKEAHRKLIIAELGLRAKEKEKEKGNERT